MKRREFLRVGVGALAVSGLGQTAQAHGSVKTSKRVWANGVETDFVRSMSPSGWPTTELEDTETIEQVQPRPSGKTLKVVSAGAYQSDGTPASGLKIQLNGSDIVDNNVDKQGDPIASVNTGSGATFKLVNETGDTVYGAGHYQVKYE